MSNNRPTHTVKLSHKRGDSDKWFSSRVGAAWERDGRIDIAIDPGVSVATPDGVRLTLWPYEEREQRGQGGGQRQQTQRGGGQSRSADFPDDDAAFTDDNIPFSAYDERTA